MEVTLRLLKKNKAVNKFKRAVKGKAKEIIEPQKDMAQKLAASLAVGKALVDRKIDYKINDNFRMKVDGNKGREGISMFYNKKF